MMPRQTAARSLALLLLSLCSACSDGGGKGTFNLDELSKRMSASGWAYLETLGESGDFQIELTTAAETSRTLGVSWGQGGVREKKAYQQIDALYLAVIYVKRNGDSFAVVLRKPKPP